MFTFFDQNIIFNAKYKTLMRILYVLSCYSWSFAKKFYPNTPLHIIIIALKRYNSWLLNNTNILMLKSDL